MKNQRIESRSQTIFRHTRAMISETSITLEKFVLCLVEAHEPVTRSGGAYRFKDTGNLIVDITANVRRVERWMKDNPSASDGRLPVDVEESWIAAMPSPYQVACKRELAARFGFLGVPIPVPGVVQDHQSLAALMREAAEAVGAIAPMLETGGGIGPEDAHLADNALEQLRDVVRECYALQSRIDIACGRHRNGAEK